MNKEIFLHQLRIRLSQLPAEELEKRLEYYSEIIDDMVEDGMSEQDAVLSFGDINMLARKIMEETPLKTLVQSSVKPKHGWSTGAIIALVLTSPIWVPLVFAFIMVIMSVYIVILSLIVAMFACVLSLGVVGVYMILKAFFLVGMGLPYMILTIGCGLLVLGLALLSVLAAKAITVGLIKLTRWFFIQIKSLFIKKEAK